MPSNGPQDLFLRTKIRASRPPRDAIERSRLDAIRTGVLHVRLTTLTAPGGFGKSTLAAIWVAHWQALGHPCAWLSLAQEDDEPARFLYCLVQAMQQLGQGVGDTALPLLQGRALTAPRAVLSLLINDLEQFEGEAVVALDDYQWIHDKAIHDAVTFLVTHAPPQFHLLITSRVLPPLSLARLRAHGEWLDVDAAMLRFDEDETTRFLTSACPRAPTSEQVALLHAGTEGWAAALRLAALSQGHTGVLDATGSGASPVFASLIEDLLENLPVHTRHFMAQTAVLERLNAHLCNAVCDSDDAATHIQLLQQHNLLVDPSDGENKWLRYHQLLREYLLGTLTQHMAVDQNLMHRRAAQWFASQSAWTDAVRHALKGGDTVQAIDWLAHCCMALVKSGDLLTLLSWRRQFPARLLNTQTQVQLAVAWGLTLAMRFTEAEPLLNDIEHTAHAARAAHTAPLKGSEPSTTVGDCLAIRAVIAALQDDSLKASEVARLWHERFNSGDTFTLNVMSNVMRYVHWKHGNLVGVYEQPWVTASHEEEQNNAFSAVYKHTLLGCVELQKARLGLAERHAREALRHAQMDARVESVSLALATPLLAMLHYLQGRCNEAAALLQPMLPLIDNTAMFESVMLAYRVLVRSARLQGRDAAAFELIERAEVIGYNRGWDRLVGAMLLERIKLLLGEGRLDEANATVIRLTRLAANTAMVPVCSRSELLVFRDMGLARLALADHRLVDARQLLTPLLEAARSTGQDLRALQIGTCLAMAHMTLGDPDACFTELRRVLQAAQRSGAIRSVLDEGDEVLGMLPRFLISKDCDTELGEFVRRLLADSHARAPDHGAPGLNNVLTERETNVIGLVAQGRSNKEIARAMNISAETVKTHLKNIFEKLGVQQRSQAVQMARLFGLNLPSTREVSGLETWSTQNQTG